MSNQYLFIDSTYRNRLSFPNPAYFDIPFSALNPLFPNDAFHVQNVVSSDYPLGNFAWNESNGLSYVEVVIVGGTPQMPVIAPNTALNQACGFDSSSCYVPLNPSSNVITGLNLLYSTNDISGVPLSNVYTILSYNPVYSQLTLSEPILTFDLSTNCLISFPVGFTNGQDFIIQGNTTILATSNTTSIHLLDLTIRQARALTISPGLDNLYFTGTADTAFDGSWNITDDYLLIKDSLPISYQNDILLWNGRYYSNNAIVDTLPIQGGQGYTVGMVCELQKQQGVSDLSNASIRITSVDANGSLLLFTVIQPGSGYTVGSIVCVFSPSVSRYATLRIQSTAQAWLTSAPFSLAFVGQLFSPLLLSRSFTVQNQSLLFAPFQTYPTPYIQYNQPVTYQDNGVSFVRSVYDISGNTLVLVLPFPSYLLDRFTMTIPAVYLSFQTYFIVYNFNGDGASNLNYTGSIVSCSQASCYEICLDSLILPNLVLDTISNGVLTSAYPFVYVEFSNISSSTSNKTAIYSNNPNATNALFLCPISDVNSPLTTSFINIASPCSQTITFKPTDNLRFRVYLPDGETFQTLIKENTLPSPINPLLQIQAVFRIKRN
jgi:hypothetical protein